MANSIVVTTGGGGSSLELQKDDSSIATGVSVLNFEDTGNATLTVTDEGSGKVTVLVNATGSTQNLFETIVVSGQSNVVADSPTDTLTFANGTGIAITTNATTDTITVTNTAPNVAQNLFETIAVSGQSNIVADSATDTLTVAGTNGIAITTNATTDTLTIARTNNLLSRHNGAVTQTFGTTPVTLTFGTNLRIDSNYTYNVNGEVTINTAGWYKVTYDISIDNPSGSTRTSSTTWLENNTAEINGTRAYGYHRTSVNGPDTLSCSILLNLAATNVLRVRSNIINGSNLSTIANACRLTFEFIGT